MRLGSSRRTLVRPAVLQPALPVWVLVFIATASLEGCARFGFDLTALEQSAAPDGPGCTACDASVGDTCANGLLDGDETGTDCGGHCGACELAPAATCSDGQLNQDEAAIDCGGVCAPCASAPGATCSDGVLNQDETGIDCGGPCAACDAGPTATCSDGVLNQDETGVDCGGRCAACIPTSCTEVVADSAAEFSGVQGQAGWYYGSYSEPNFTSSAFIELPDFRLEPSVGEEGWFAESTWTWIGRLRMHPNGRMTNGGRLSLEQHAVRRWISTVSEPLYVQGSLRSTSPQSSGIVGRILVNDSEVWARTVAPGDTQSQAIEALVTVQPGDAVNITLDPYQSNDGADDTEFAVQLCR